MLIEMFGSRDERERIAAADALGKLEARAAASAVTRTMEDESRAVRVAAIVAAGKIRTPEAVDRLVEVVRAGHEKGERPQAVIALGLIGDERAVPAVIRALDDRRLRGWAIEALGRIAGSDAEAAIRHAQIPAWHRWDHLRRRQALTRIAQRTGVGSPLVSALAERVARAAVSLLGAGIVIGVAAGLRDARVWPSVAVAAAITGVYAAWRMWRSPGVVAARVLSAQPLPERAPATERWSRTAMRQFPRGIAVLVLGLAIFGLIALVAPVEVAAGVAAGLFRWPSYAREAARLAHWQRRERRRLLHELIDDENDRYFLTA